MAEQKTAYIFLSDENRFQSDKGERLDIPSTDEQLEIFALKYHDVDRDSLRYIADVSATNSNLVH